jgi:hypothetical protein
LIGALDRPQTGRLNKIFGGVTRSRHYQRVAPKARQARIKSRPHFASAIFAHSLWDHDRTSRAFHCQSLAPILPILVFGHANPNLIDDLDVERLVNFDHC